MMRVLFNRTILLAFVISLIAPCLATAMDTTSDEINKAAKEGFKTRFKNKKHDNHFQKQGFESQTDLDNAELGEGFPIFNIDYNKLSDDSSTQDIQALAAPTNEWRFPVVAGGKVKTLFRLGFTGGVWISYEMAPSQVATEINGIMAVWPVSLGYSYRYIRVLRAATEFIEISNGDKVVGFIPLSALMAKTKRNRGEFKDSDLLDPHEMLNTLQLQTKKNNESFREPSEEVMTAAKEALFQEVKKLEIDNLRKYGFESQADIDDAKLGDGFREFIIDTSKLLDESTSQDFESILITNNKWYFPIVANGSIKLLISIGFIDGKWRISGMQSSGLAREMRGLKATWPATSGYQYRYINGRFVSSNFIELSKGGKVVGIIPLKTLYSTPGRIAGEFKPSDLRDPQEILSELRLQINTEQNSE